MTMHSRASVRPNPHSARGGFSLIEMLVVMVIMGILTAIAFAVLGRTGEAARKAQTLTTIRELNSLLQARHDEFLKNLNSPKVQGFLKNQAAQLRMMGRTEPLAALTAILAMERYRGTFPQREEDLFGFDGIEGTADDSPLLKVWRVANPLDVAWRSKRLALGIESSELLVLSLKMSATKGAGDDVFESVNVRDVRDDVGNNVLDLADDQNGNGTLDSDEVDRNGLPELYDGWGNPLRFYNAPTRLVRPGGPDTPLLSTQKPLYAVAQALMASVPAAPTDAIAATNFTNSFNQNPFDPNGALHKPKPVPPPPLGTPPDRYFDEESQWHTPDTWYQPMIVSCGPDEILGLGEPTAGDVTRLGQVIDSDGDGDIDGDDTAAAADDLTNLQRVGG